MSNEKTELPDSGNGQRVRERLETALRALGREADGTATASNLFYNLGAVLTDMDRTKADRVCRDTIRKVLAGLAIVEREVRAACDEYERGTPDLLRKLSDAVDEVLAPLGCYGTISNRDDRVIALMDVMYEVDAVLKKNGEHLREPPTRGFSEPKGTDSMPQQGGV